jgi:ATP-binding cassette subfamily C protein
MPPESGGWRYCCPEIGEQKLDSRINNIMSQIKNVDLSKVKIFLRDHIKEVYPIFFAAMVFSFFINLLMFISPLYMLQIYDRVIGSRSIPTLIALTVLAGFLLLVYAILEWLRSRVLVRAGLIFDEKIADPVFEAIHRGNIRMPGGGHVQCLRDMDTLREFLTGSGLIVLCDVPWFPIFVAASFFLHPWYGYIAIFGSVVTLGLAYLNEVATKKHLNNATVANMRATNSASAVFRNAEVLQAMGMILPLKNIWLSQHDKVLAAQAMASDRSGVITALTKFFRMFLQTIILGVGAYLVIQREISGGAIIAGSILIGRALQPIEMAVAQWKSFIAARSSFERITTLFKVAGETTEKMSLPKPRGHVSVSNIVASAPSNPKNIILKGLSFDIPAGAIVGVVGPSGAGKSSLARVLVGVWPILQGNVRLDGNDLDHWNNHELGVHIGYLPQDVELFSGTIAQNISRFVDADPEQIIKAATLAGCHDLIQQLEEGYNTQIGENGISLSGGQRQRIGLARALFGDPRLLVLDEPNASLDSQGEEALHQALVFAKSHGSTIVIITHKISALRSADLILVMSGGGAQAYGQRDQILAKLMSQQGPQNSDKQQGPQVGSEKSQS